MQAQFLVLTTVICNQAPLSQYTALEKHKLEANNTPLSSLQHLALFIHQRVVIRYLIRTTYPDSLNLEETDTSQLPLRTTDPNKHQEPPPFALILRKTPITPFHISSSARRTPTPPHLSQTSQAQSNPVGMQPQTQISTPNIPRPSTVRETPPPPHP
ncbi:hypothetical protein F5Y15DRAFT_232551 [Xylariaceae sp. FL0016]|nr:hypothetical protein F5Y15DRAFT_232551 [Xylariaceae sp. FL0016]